MKISLCMYVSTSGGEQPKRIKRINMHTFFQLSVGVTMNFKKTGTKNAFSNIVRMYL